MKKLTTKEFITKSNKIHNNEFDYSKVNYINSQTKIIIICSLHGEFEQKPNNHITGKGCYRCKGSKTKKTCLDKYGVDNPSKLDSIKNKKEQNSLQKYGVKSFMSTKEFKQQSKKTCLDKYGVDNPSKSKKIRDKTKQTNFERYGVGNVYQNENVINDIQTKRLKTISSSGFKKDIIEKNKILRLKFVQNYVGDDYLVIEYNDYYNIKIKNNKSGEIKMLSLYTIRSRKNNNRDLCKSVSGTSNLEKELSDFIKENYDGKMIISDRLILQPSELDIYLPELKLAFEFNGLYWHSEFHKDKSYHLDKTEKCLQKDIHLIHIYEDDWLYKTKIVKSRILNLLQKSTRIYGRKCEIKQVKDYRKFLVDNHLQGFVPSDIRLGLYYENELVSLMTFGKVRFKNNDYELLRFCNKLNTTVIGGSSKLFKHFVKNNKFGQIVSYADRSWSKGNLYENLNFEYTNKTLPNYYYVVNDNGFKYRKSELIKEEFNKNLSEKEIMRIKKQYKIYDSGNLKFVYE